MPDETRLRPVSGEIMTDARSARAEPCAKVAEDVVDAEFEVVGESQMARGFPASSPPPRSGPSQGAPPSMEMLRNAPKRGQSALSRAGPFFWMTGICLVLMAFWISGGHVLLRAAPRAAMAATSHAVRLEQVRTRVVTISDRQKLLIDGEIANGGDERATAPRLQIVVGGKDGTATIYVLDTGGGLVAPGDRFAFSSRLDAPRSGVASVSVAIASKDAD